MITKTLHPLALLALHFACGTRAEAPSVFSEGIIYVQLLGAIAPSRHPPTKNHINPHTLTHTHSLAHLHRQIQPAAHAFIAHHCNAMEAASAWADLQHCIHDKHAVEFAGPLE